MTFLTDSSVFPMVPHKASSWLLLFIFIHVWLQTTVWRLDINLGWQVSSHLEG